MLGSDCSILVGIALGLRRRGRYGLLFLDGHADFYQPEAEPTGEAAPMELALVTGRGPEIVTNLEGRRPLVRDQDVVIFGFRPPCAHWISRQSASEGSSGRRLMLAHLERKDGPTGSWIHLDVDILDDALMLAVDYRLPDGLSWDELIAVLRPAVASGRRRPRGHDLQ